MTEKSSTSFQEIRDRQIPLSSVAMALEGRKPRDFAVVEQARADIAALLDVAEAVASVHNRAHLGIAFPCAICAAMDRLNEVIPQDHPSPVSRGDG